MRFGLGVGVGACPTLEGRPRRWGCPGGRLASGPRGAPPFPTRFLPAPCQEAAPSSRLRRVLPEARHVRCGVFAGHASRERSWARRPGNAGVPPALSGGGLAVSHLRAGRPRSQDAVPAQAAPRGEIRQQPSRTDPEPRKNAVSVGVKNISTPDLYPLYQVVTNSARGSRHPWARGRLPAHPIGRPRPASGMKPAPLAETAAPRDVSGCLWQILPVTPVSRGETHVVALRRGQSSLHP